jgi:sarcosine oxidase subunit beta
MRTKADAVIIGGGIIGVAVAFYLAKAKYGQIVLVEKDRFLGAGSTSKAAGGIRAQFSTKVNIEMSMLSEKLFCRFKEDTGHEALYDQVGYLFLLSEESDVQEFRISYELQRLCGLKVELLKPDEIAQYAPHVRTDDILLATFCHDDGLADPHEFLQGYEKADRQMGVEIDLETEVTGFAVTSGKITGVKTNNGTISSPVVINCAGAYAGEIGKMVGATVPVLPYRRQCVTTGPLDFVKPFFPMVVDVKSGLYCHKESKGMLLGWADKNVKPGFDISVDPDYTDAILERALDRIPQLETAEIGNRWAGLYETTPDHRAIVGWEPRIEGMFHTTGFSGHGLMHAPAAGLITAETITGKKTSVDITDLSSERFAKGTVVEEVHVI